MTVTILTNRSRKFQYTLVMGIYHPLLNCVKKNPQLLDALTFNYPHGLCKLVVLQLTKYLVSVR